MEPIAFPCCRIGEVTIRDVMRWCGMTLIPLGGVSSCKEDGTVAMLDAVGSEG